MRSTVTAPIRAAVPFQPEWEGNLRFSWFPNPRFTLFGEWHYTSSYYTINEYRYNKLGDETDDGVAYPSLSVINAGVKVKPGKAWQIAFGCNDIFNREDFYKVLLGILTEQETVILSTHLLEEVEHLLLPRDKVMESYVVEDPKCGAITAFGSFYSLPSTAIANPKYKRLNAAYLYYCVNMTGPVGAVVSDLLVMAKKHHYDVFNCLEIMDNSTFLQDLKFGPGDGLLHYYLFNWAMPAITPDKLGLVLV